MPSGLRTGLHGDSRDISRRTMTIRRGPAPGSRPGCHLLGHGPELWQRHSERLVSRALAGHRDQVKRWRRIRHRAATGAGPASTRRNASRLLRGVHDPSGVELHRLVLPAPGVDRAVPVEDTIGAMADLVAEGKVGHLGISECSASRSSVPPASIRLPPCSSSGRCGGVSPRNNVIPVARRWGSAWCPTARSAAASSPMHPCPRRSGPVISAAVGPELRSAPGSQPRPGRPVPPPGGGPWRDHCPAGPRLAARSGRGSGVVPIPGTTTKRKVSF